MSVQKHGVEYLKSYSGILKITEEVLSLAVIISGCICGFGFKTILIIAASIYGFCSTVFFLFVNYRSVFKKSTFPWDWVECANSVTIAVVYTLGASITLTELTREFIITGIIGYIAAMVFVLETIDKFKLAITPRARYVWTTPNMPE